MSRKGLIETAALFTVSIVITVTTLGFLFGSTMDFFGEFTGDHTAPTEINDLILDIESACEREQTIDGSLDLGTGIGSEPIEPCEDRNGEKTRLCHQGEVYDVRLGENCERIDTSSDCSDLLGNLDYKIEINGGTARIHECER